jgi:hypothetical protein
LTFPGFSLFFYVCALKGEINRWRAKYYMEQQKEEAWFKQEWGRAALERNILVKLYHYNICRRTFY